MIARVDFPPRWARPDGRNGPPNRYQDYADFLSALADHFKHGSPHGTSITNPDGSARPAYEALLQARRNGYLP